MEISEIVLELALTLQRMSVSTLLTLMLFSQVVVEPGSIMDGY